MSASADERSPWGRELNDLVRGASGGMLFGIPLLYTMEVWWIGATTGPLRMLVVLAITFAIVLLLNRTAGFRSTADVRLADALRDSVEALAVALLCVLVILALLREIDVGSPLREVVGKMVYEATPFAIGVGLARHFLRKGRTQGDDEGDGSEAASNDGDAGALSATATDIGATVLGSVFVAAAIAPTDEVPMITAALSPLWLVAFVAITLVISYCIVFEAGFSNEEQRRSAKGGIQHPLTETLACYLVALAVAATMLWFFQQSTFDHLSVGLLGEVVVLGLPAAVGGAAGRLAV